MKVLILGATGGTGRPTLEFAAAQGHEVTVLVRDPTSLPADSGARVVVGDATDPAVLAEACAGQDAVINALGSRSVRHPVEAESTRVLLPALVDAGVTRLIVCSAFGVGESREGANTLQKLFFSTVLGRVYEAKEEADDAVRASSLDWTLVYPTRLTDDPETTRIQSIETFAGVGRISRADVARFMVEQLASSEWSRKTVIVTGAA